MGIAGINNGNYRLYTGESQSAQKTDGVNGDKDLQGSVNALKFTEAYKRIQFAVSHPEIEGGRNLTAEEIDEHVQEVSKKVADLKGLFRGKSVMFSIYDLMELIQRIGQLLRDAMRETRRAQNMAIYANIRSQAAIQRSAARAAMIAGAVMCTLQAGVTLFMMGKQLKNLGDQKSLQQQQGIDVLEEQMDMTKVCGDKTLAAKQYQKVVESTPAEVREQASGERLAQTSETQTKINQGHTDVKSAETKLNEAEAKLQSAEQLQSDAQKRLDAFQPGEKGERLATAQKNLDTAQSKVDQAKAELQKAEGDWDQLAKKESGSLNKSPEWKAAKEATVKAKVKLDDAVRDFGKAETAYNEAKTAAEAEAGAFKQNFTEPRDNLAKAEQKFTEAKGELEQAKKAYSEASAAEPKDEAKCADLRQKLDAAQTKFNEADRNLASAKWGDKGTLHAKLERAAELSAKVKTFDEQLQNPEMQNNAEARNAAEVNKASCKAELETLKAELKGAGISEAQVDDYAQAKQDLATAQKGVAEAKGPAAEAKAKLDEACENYKKLTGVEIKGAEDLAKPDTIKAESKMVHEALLRDVEVAHGKWEGLRSKANNELRVNGKVSPETQKALDTAAQTYKLARAEQVLRSSELPGLDASDYDAANLKAIEHYSAASKLHENSGDALKARRSEVIMSALISLNQLFSSYSSTFINSLKENMSAKGTELAAEQKLTEDQLDQIKELMQQALNLIQKAIDIFQSVIAKESQTIDQLSNSFA